MLTVERLSESSPGEPAELWDAYIAGNRDADLYHTREWAALIREVFGHRPHYLLARRGSRPVGVLAIFEIRLPLLGRKLVSMPYDAGSGGPLADDPEAERALAGHALALAKELRARSLELRCGHDRPSLESMSFHVDHPIMLSETCLEAGSEAWERVAPDQRKSLSKAERRGVRVRLADDPADYDAFYEVYLRVFRDFGTPPYARRYFVAVSRSLVPHARAQLLLAEREGAVIGGALLFCFGSTAISKFAVVLPDAVEYRTFSALYGKTLDICIERGFRKVGWGTSSRTQTGLIDFKERWGAETRPVTIYTRTRSGRPVSLEKYYDSDPLARKLWRRLPVRLTPVPGHTLNRWFC